MKFVREHETKENAMLGGIVPELIETELYSGVANYSGTICRDSSPQANKTRMPQMPVRCPFGKLDLGHEPRLEPPAVFHVLLSQAIVPPSASKLRQVYEWAAIGLPGAVAD